MKAPRKKEKYKKEIDEGKEMLKKKAEMKEKNKKK